MNYEKKHYDGKNKTNCTDKILIIINYIIINSEQCICTSYRYMYTCNLCFKNDTGDLFKASIYYFYYLIW